MNLSSPQISSNIVAVASGKGGVGKTGITLNLAALLAKSRKRVLVVDGDLGLANIDVQLGLTPETDLADVMSGKATLKQAVMKGPEGIDIVAGRAGTRRLTFTDALARHDLFKHVQKISSDYDLVLVDVAAGAGAEVLDIIHHCGRMLLVVTPDPAAITDAYALVKLLQRTHGLPQVEVLVNMANDADGRRTHEKLATSAQKFLQIDLPLGGIIPFERGWSLAVKMQQLALQSMPHGKSVEKLRDVASNLLK